MSQQGDDFERQKRLQLQREDAIRAHDRAKEFETKTNEATVASGQVAIRTAVFINGGAAITVLGLIGGLVGQGRLSVAQLSSVAGTLMWFAFGVASGAAALALSYFTNYGQVASSQLRDRTWTPPYLTDTPKSINWRRASKGFQVAAVITGLLSLALFVGGMFAVRNAIKHLV